MRNLLSSFAIFIGWALSSASAQTVMSPTAWIEHVRDDLLPFWDMPDAWGQPVGNFPSRRCNTGAAFVRDTPCEEVARIPWIADEQQFVVALSRQIYAYGVAFHLTGEPRYLTFAEAGARHLIAHGIDQERGFFFTRLDPGTFVGQSDLDDRTSQMQAYGMLGLAFLYYLTGREALLTELLAIARRFQQDHLDVERGLYVFPGDRGDRVTLASQLDHLNAYMQLLSRILPDDARKPWLREMERLADTIVDLFFVENLGLFSNERINGERQSDYDFGHSVKAFWFIRMAGAAVGRPDLVEWAEARGLTLIEKAFVADTGSWALGYGPDFRRDLTPMSWVHAELSQFTASLALSNADLWPRLARVNRFWMRSFVDPETGGVWDRLDAQTGAPVTSPPKHWHWKAGYHSFEHAMVGHITAGAATSKPIRLHFVRDEANAMPFQPYYFTARVAGIEIRSAPGGRDLQTVTFSDVDW